MKAEPARYGYRGALFALLIPLTLYVFLALPANYLVRDRTGQDAVVYLRYAKYIAEGRFSSAVGGPWSPMLPYCVAPFLLFSDDSLWAIYAAKIVTGIWGGLLVVATYLLMRSLGLRTKRILIILLCVVAIMAVRGSQHTTQDVIHSTMLIAYCACVLRTDFLSRKGLQLLAGALAGLAYLGKAYALPFFFLHFPLLLLARWVFQPHKYNAVTVGKALALGGIAFGLVAGPWITVLSAKYGRLTYSTISSPLMGMLLGSTEHVSWDRTLRHVPKGHVFFQEVDWESMYAESKQVISPTSWFKELLHGRIRFLLDMIDSLGAYDLLHFTLPMLILWPFLALRRGSGRWRSERVQKGVLALGTLALFLLPFVFIGWEDRYIRYFSLPMICAFFGSMTLPAFAPLLRKAGVSRSTIRFLLLLILASYLAASLIYLGRAVRSPRQTQRSVRSMADQLISAGCEGPIAIMWYDSVFYRTGVFMAYHMDTPFLGAIDQTDVAEICRQLKKYGVRTFLVHSDSKLREAFSQSSGWRHILTLRREAPAERSVLLFREQSPIEEILVYVPPDEAVKQDS